MSGSRLLALFVGALLLFASVARAQGDLHEERRWTMGTELRIVLVGAGERAPEICNAAFALVDALEDSLSTWDPSTPLSRLNARAGERVRVSAFVFSYLERVRRDHRRTGGAFDPSVGTWRGLADEAPRPRVGFDGIETGSDDDGFWARLPHADFALDTGGDGKGVAVDHLVRLLRDEGVESALIDFGGSSWYGLGRPPEGMAWTVTVPGVDGVVAGELALVDRALSVSQSSQFDVEPSGEVVRRWHIFDPRTGARVTTPRVAVVTGDSATEAEVWSTALIVDGAEALARLEGDPSLKAFVLDTPGQAWPDSTGVD